MLLKTLTISNKLGLHARAASLFVKTASTFEAEVSVCNTETDKKANGKSIMSMMLLEAGMGHEIHVEVNGPDELKAMTAIEDMVNNKFGEAE